MDAPDKRLHDIEERLLALERERHEARFVVDNASGTDPNIKYPYERPETPSHADLPYAIGGIP